LTNGCIPRKYSFSIGNRTCKCRSNIAAFYRKLNKLPCSSEKLTIWVNIIDGVVSAIGVSIKVSRITTTPDEIDGV